MVNWTLLVIFGIFVNYADSQYPGARIILTSKALDYVSSFITPLLEKELSELKITDVSDDIGIMIIGRIHYALSNIHLDVPSTKSLMVKSSTSTNGITFRLSEITLISKCNWKYKMEYWPYFGDNGTVEIKIRDAVVKLSVLVTKSTGGYPVMHTTKCVVILPSLSIDLHGSSRWLNRIYGLFQSKMEGDLKETLKSKLCDYVINTTTEWNEAISSYPLSKEINNFTVTYGLLRDPVFSSNQIQFDLEGEVLTTMSDDSLSQSVVHVLPAVESKDKMIHLLLTDKLFATGITAAIHSDLLNYKITPDKLPSSSSVKLNTEFFKHIVPELFKQFPQSAVIMAIDINKYKEVYLDLAGVHVSLLGNLLLQVIQQDGTTVDAFSIELEVYCTMEANIILQPDDKLAVLLEATDLQATLGNLTSSSFGEFEIAPLERAINGISLPLMFIINEHGKKGFTIPNMDTVNFIHPLITLKKDCIQVSADFECLLRKS